VNENLYFGEGRNNVAYSTSIPMERALLPFPLNTFFDNPDSGWSRDQLQPWSFPTAREAEEREPGNEVTVCAVCLFVRISQKLSKACGHFSHSASIDLQRGLQKPLFRLLNNAKLMPLQ